MEKPAVERIDKPWGHECVWARTSFYAGKTLFVRAGESLSLQYHREKEETLHLLSGRVLLEAGPSVAELRPVDLEVGESLHLPPGTVHRVQALEDTEILEVSTPELDDVVRLEDRYGRA